MADDPTAAGVGGSRTGRGPPRRGLLDKPAKKGYDFYCQTLGAADASATDFRSPKGPCECNGLQAEEVSSNHYI